MTETGAKESKSAGRPPMWVWALGVTFLMQATVSFVAQAIPVLGPTLTAEAGVPHERIGYLTSLVSLGSLWFLAGGGSLLTHFGPVRTLQLGALVGAFGLLFVPSGVWPIMVLAALMIGIGYGPSPPAGSELLMRHSPPEHRSLIFSIKQAGAPLGGAMAGFILPALTAFFSWRIALASAAVVTIGSVALVQPLRGVVDRGTSAGGRAPFRTMFARTLVSAPFRAVSVSRQVIILTLLGFTYSAVQGSLFGLYVTFLNTHLHFDLTEAGTAFALMQGIGVFSRILIGWIADRLIPATRLLIILGIWGMAMVLVISTMDADWPLWIVMTVSAISGFAVASWNGVYLAEVARLAPEGKIGDVTSGSTFFTFMGYVIGPAVFATIVEQTGSYHTGFVAFAGLPLIAVAVLLVERARGTIRP